MMNPIKVKIFFVLMLVILGTISCKKTQEKSQKESPQSYSEEELYRPNFHFTPKRNWMNDPNGMFYYNGNYHLYYQHHPESNVWGPMHWGHAISTDMISWTEQPIALYPDELGTIFSGSAVVDFNNTSGFGKTEKSTPIVAIYTNSKKLDGEDNWKQTQSIAYSHDEGKTFTKFKDNPVIDNDEIEDFRDPKVTWDENRNRWVMSLAVGDKISFYASQDLKDWTYLSDFGQNIGGHGGVWECPDLFKLPVEGSDEEKWILLVSINPGGPNGGSATQYFVGDFDGTNFNIDSDVEQRMQKTHDYWIDFGRDNYAGVTWFNSETKEGNRLMIGWMSNWDYAQKVPTESWRSAMTIAREIRLKKDSQSYRLISKPVDKLSKYRGEKFERQEVSITGETKIIGNKKINLASAELHFEIDDLKPTTYTFKLSNTAGDKLLFGYNHKDKTFFIDRSESGRTAFSDKFANHISTAPRTSSSSSLTGTILIDKTSIELFFDDGETVMTEIFFPNAPYETLELSSGNAEFMLDHIKVNELEFD